MKIWIEYMLFNVHHVYLINSITIFIMRFNASIQKKWIIQFNKAREKMINMPWEEESLRHWWRKG